MLIMLMRVRVSASLVDPIVVVGQLSLQDSKTQKVSDIHGSFLVKSF